MNVSTRNLISLISKFRYTPRLAIHQARCLSTGLRKPFGLGQYLVKYKFSTSGLKEVNQAQDDSGVESNLQQFIANPKTIQILQSKGIASLFPIQQQTFTAVYQGRDILASDRTGSGKTIAYSLPIIQKLRDSQVFKSGRRQVKFLVMCPTRELTLQVYKEIASLRHNKDDFNVVAVYGGASIDDQTRELRNGVDIIVATPGRLMDMLERKCVNFTELQVTCIDEADQMLQKGFKLDIQQIFQQIQSQRKQKTQNLMFSATIPDWVEKICRQYLSSNKKKINLINKNQTQTSTTVEFLAVECRYHDRLNCIKNLIKQYNGGDGMSTIIFAEKKLEVTDLAMEFGKDAAFLQGDMAQKEREFNLAAFRSGKRKILIATDVASRGLDIDNVGLVIQLQPPRNTEPFIHRAGRTGRAGRKGICITLFDRKKNIMQMLRVQNQAKITFKHIPKPIIQESQQIWQKKLNKVPHTIKQLTSQHIPNQKIDAIVQSLLSSNPDSKQLLRAHVLALVGEPPVSLSLINEEEGYRTFVLGMRQAEAKLNSLTALNFLKQEFKDFGITNVHVQSRSIIFDVPMERLNQSEINITEVQQLKDSPFALRQAVTDDRQMAPLRQLAKSGGSRDGSRGDRDVRSRRNEVDQQGDLKAFIPNLPFEIQKQDIEEQLSQLRIQFQSIRVVKKSQTNVFAFIALQDPLGLKYLIRNGLNINGAKAKVYQAQNKSEASQRKFGGKGREDRGDYGRRQDKGEYGRRQDRGYDNERRSSFKRGGY